jgi:hypothetical protein
MTAVPESQTQQSRRVNFLKWILVRRVLGLFGVCEVDSSPATLIHPWGNAFCPPCANAYLVMRTSQGRGEQSQLGHRGLAQGRPRVGRGEGITLDSDLSCSTPAVWPWQAPWCLCCPVSPLGCCWVLQELQSVKQW